MAPVDAATVGQAPELRAAPPWPHVAPPEASSVAMPRYAPPAGRWSLEAAPLLRRAAPWKPMTVAVLEAAVASPPRSERRGSPAPRCRAEVAGGRSGEEGEGQATDARRGKGGASCGCCGEGGWGTGSTAIGGGLAASRLVRGEPAAPRLAASWDCGGAVGPRGGGVGPCSCGRPISAY